MSDYELSLSAITGTAEVDARAQRSGARNRNRLKSQLVISNNAFCKHSLTP